MKKLFILIIVLIVFTLSPLNSHAQALRWSQHTYKLTQDSLFVYQEAGFTDIVEWETYFDTISINPNNIIINLYYGPDTVSAGTLPIGSSVSDTFLIEPLNLGQYMLVVNSFEHRDSIDIYFNVYEYFALADVDTSYFQVLSDKTYRLNKSPISIYPNPANDWVTMQGLKPEDGEVFISILDFQGKEVLKTKASYYTPQLWVGDLPKGKYMLTGESIAPTQFLIQ